MIKLIICGSLMIILLIVLSACKAASKADQKSGSMFDKYKEQNDNKK